MSTNNFIENFSINSKINKFLKNKIIKPIEKKIIKPIKQIEKQDPNIALFNKVKKQLETNRNPKKNIVIPPQEKITHIKKDTNNNSLINIINNPTIPSTSTLRFPDYYNKNTISYLDNDIYYTNNTQKYNLKEKVPKTNIFFKILFIAIMSILGILVILEFYNDPRHRWNIFILYIILLYLIIFKYNINKKYLFFDNIKSPMI